MRKQFAAFRENKASVREDECIVHVDFSENFNCKFHSEVQAVHFGASHAQASLHTVVLYTASSEPKCMCTVSECLDHGPAGIWAHLKPILHYIQKEYPTVQHLTFWSDGPSSQYKQKKNFFRFSTDPLILLFCQYRSSDTLILSYGELLAHSKPSNQFKHVSMRM